MTNRVALFVALLSCLTACNGGHGKSNNSGLPQLPGPQSPGGAWGGLDSGGETVVLWVAENGDLIAQLNPGGQLIPSIGSGVVAVTQNDVIGGSFELGVLGTPPLNSMDNDLACSIAGTLQQRQSMSVDITCADTNGPIYDESLTMTYESRIYERASSLAALAGNYTFAVTFDPGTNFLSIGSDGTISGMYNNGAAQCNVTGIASIIAPEYTLIAIDWTMSGCSGLFGQTFEGVQLSGFALEISEPAGTPGDYIFMLTGRVQDRVYVISVRYSPT